MTHHRLQPVRGLVHAALLASAFAALPAFAAAPVASCHPYEDVPYSGCVLDFGSVLVKAENIRNGQPVYEVDESMSRNQVDLGQVSVSPTGAAFSLEPQFRAAYGGSGYVEYIGGGFHISNLNFEAAPGYALNAVTATISGTVRIFGPANVTLKGGTLDSAQQFDFEGKTGQAQTFAFSFTGTVPPNLDQPVWQSDPLIFWQGLAPYGPGYPGYPAVYSTAEINIDKVTFTASATAVPEPTQGLLALGGLAVVGALARRARRQA